MWPISLFATKRDRILAQDEARYALRDYGDKAEAKLRWKAERTQSRERRRIYRLAIREVARRGVAD